jgi:hypothetical protein
VTCDMLHDYFSHVIHSSVTYMLPQASNDMISRAF